MSSDSAGRDELIGRTATEILLALTDPENEDRAAGEVLKPVLGRLADALSRQAAQGGEAVACESPYGILKVDEYGAYSFILTGRPGAGEYEMGPVVDHEKLAQLGWQSIECPACGSYTAKGFPKDTVPRAELEQFRKDAERYRWLRDPCKPVEKAVLYSKGDFGHGLFAFMALDKAIDRAMQEGKE